MADKILTARTIQMHDVEENWNKAVSFIPKRGEIIVYDPDSLHQFTRFKIGNGITPVGELPFIVEKNIRDFFNNKDDIFYIDSGRISDYQTIL